MTFVARVMLISAFLGAAAVDRAFQKSLPKPQSGLVPDRRYRKFGELGAKKVFSYNAMKRFLVRGHSRPPERPFVSLNRPLSRAVRTRQITNLALRKRQHPYN